MAMKYLYFVFYRLVNEDGKTFYEARTWIWLLCFIPIAGYLMASKALSGLILYFFTAFNVGNTANPYIQESIESFKGRSIKSRIFITNKLIN